MNISYGIFKFIERDDYLKLHPGDPPLGLLSLVHDFRHRKATMAWDKLYAIQGLIRTTEHSLNIPISYEEGFTTDLWSDFSKACIKHYRSLLVLALTDGVDIINGRDAGRSWSIDWGDYGKDEKRRPLWAGGLNDKLWYPLTARYQAAGNAKARVRTETLDRNVTLVQGFVHDTIVKLGHSISRSASEPAYFTKILSAWEEIARTASPLESMSDANFHEIFNQTLMAGNWAKSSQDWRVWNTDTSSIPERAEYLAIRNAALRGRRLFVTSSGKFGICHSDAQVNDIICVLLGSNVPFVLRKKPDRTGPLWRHWAFFARNDAHGRCCMPVRHMLVGQVYLHGIMWYNSDMERDIEEGRVTIQNFFIR